jgi:hypothetical protein
LDDLIVGAVYADPNGNSSGKSYVVFGKANNSAINLSDIANANNLSRYHLGWRHKHPQSNHPSHHRLG